MLSVSIIIPTRNECENISTLLSQIKPYGYEAIVVDDSDDDTPAIARKLGATVVEGQRKGLGQAIVDGINASDSDVVVVMDADLSHNPQAIPSLLKPILEQGCDFVIGSRYVKGGDFSNWALKRQIQSIIGVKLMQMVTGVRDSNSGFFAFRKSIIDDVELKAYSWKIMLEVLFRGKWTNKQEVPITFNDRSGGVSKNSNAERVKHAKHLLRLLVWKFRRYITFACVGGIGAIWYFGLLYFFTEYVDIWYGFSAIVATFVAITNNYLINHFYTFRRDKHLNENLFKGWLKYVGNSAIGDGIDWCILIMLTEVFGLWYMLSAFLASAVASVLKYTIAKKFIWSKKGRTAKSEDYEWHSFFKGMPWQKYSKQLIAKKVIEYAGDAGVVADIGCGASPQGVMVAHSGYSGVDLDDGKVAYMNEKNLSNAQFMVGDVMDLPLDDNYADTVLFIEVIEHLNSVDDILKALGEIARVVKLNGRVIIAMPDFSSLPGRAMEKLYGIIHPQAYADDHKMKLNTPILASLCDSKGLLLERSANLLKRDVVLSLRKINGNCCS